MGLEWQLYQKKIQMDRAKSKKGNRGANTVENLGTKKTLVGTYMGNIKIGNLDKILKNHASSLDRSEWNLQRNRRWSIQR